MFYRILIYNLKLTLRQRSDWLNPLLFFIIVVSLFPLAISTEKAVLIAIAPGVIWIAAVLASLLSLPQLFQADFIDGSLDQLLLQPEPLTYLVAAKLLAHWLTHQLPLILVAPLVGLLFQLSNHSIGILIISLLLGTPTLSLLGGIIAALIVSLRGQVSLLLPLLLLPLLIPLLLFATNVVLAAEQGFPINGQLALLAALMLLAMAFAPWVIAIALRIGVEV